MGAASEAAVTEKLKTPDKALEQMKLGVIKHPKQFELLLTLTDFYSLLGDNLKSLRSARLLVSTFPTRIEGYLRLITAAIVLRNLIEAKLIAEKAILITKNPAFLVILSNIAFVQNDMDMLDYCERMFAKQLSCEDIYDGFNISPQSYQSKLLVEYSSQGEKDLPNTIAKKPDLYVVAGFSGSGKTTFLDSACFAVDKIFCREKVTVQMFPPEICKFLSLRHANWYNRDQSMLFCDAFTDIEQLSLQDTMPRQTLLQLNLTHLLFNGYPRYFGLPGLQEADLKFQRRVSDHFRHFFNHPFFTKFATISIATICIDFEVNSFRYSSRTGNSFHFKPEMKDTYNQVRQIWLEAVSSLTPYANYVITEIDSSYVVNPQ